MALGAGVAFACSALAMRRVALIATPAGAIDPLRPLVLGNLIGAVAGAPFWLAAPVPDLVGWSALLALGVFQQASAYFCYAAAIRRARAIDVVLVPVIEPILSPLWVGLAFGEWPSRGRWSAARSWWARSPRAACWDRAAELLASAR